MAVENFTIDLFVDETVSPPYYWAESSAEFSDVTHFANGVNLIPDVPDSEGVLHVSVVAHDAGSPPVNPVNHSIDIGQVTFEELSLSLTDGSGTLATGTVKTKEAQQETRPWE